MGDDAFHTQSLAMNVPRAIEKFDEWLKHPKNHLQAGEFLSLFPSTVKAYAPHDMITRQEPERRCGVSIISSVDQLHIFPSGSAFSSKV